MDDLAADQLEKIRQQFDSAPYPRRSLDQSPKQETDLLFIHNFVTAFYLKTQTVATTKDRLILDAGCGSGYKSLVLAEANPEAKIVGIDLSAESVKLARQRLQYHGFAQAEFHALAIADLPQLGLKFDYINCDDVLYLFPDPASGLKAMKSVLKPDGIIRANLHSSLQRVFFYRTQELFKHLGLMDSNPEEEEITAAREFIRALKDNVVLKSRTWFTSEVETKDESVLMNYLFQGDRGFTILDLFRFLESANLELIRMIPWKKWNLQRLFPNFSALSPELNYRLSNLSLVEQLHLVELLNPTQRLLDFWCGHPASSQYRAVSDWSITDWNTCRVHLHPQLNTLPIDQAFIQTIEANQSLEITQWIKSPVTEGIRIESTIAACLLPLWDAPQPFTALVQRFLTLNPTDPVTLEPVSEQQACQQLQSLLIQLNELLYVLLETAASA